MWTANPDIFKSAYVVKSCQASYRTINQDGDTTCRPCFSRVNSDIIGCVWTGQFDLNTLLVNREIFESGKKKLRIKYPDTCGRGIKNITQTCCSFFFYFKEVEITDEINLSMNCRSANLILPPKKGTAVMWYNNFIDPESGLLGSVDRRTLHGGCDVIRGEKWIANNWLRAPTKHSRYIKSIFDKGFD